MIKMEFICTNCKKRIFFDHYVYENGHTFLVGRCYSCGEENVLDVIDIIGEPKEAT